MLKYWPAVIYFQSISDFPNKIKILWDPKKDEFENTIYVKTIKKLKISKISFVEVYDLMSGLDKKIFKKQDEKHFGFILKSKRNLIQCHKEQKLKKIFVKF